MLILLLFQIRYFHWYFPSPQLSKKERAKKNGYTFSQSSRFNPLVPGYIQRTRPRRDLVCLVCEKEFGQIRATRINNGKRYLCPNLIGQIRNSCPYLTAALIYLEQYYPLIMNVSRLTFYFWFRLSFYPVHLKTELIYRELSWAKSRHTAGNSCICCTLSINIVNACFDHASFSTAVLQTEVQNACKTYQSFFWILCQG